MFDERPPLAIACGVCISSRKLGSGKRLSGHGEKFWFRTISSTINEDFLCENSSLSFTGPIASDTEFFKAVAYSSISFKSLIHYGSWCDRLKSDGDWRKLSLGSVILFKFTANAVLLSNWYVNIPLHWDDCEPLYLIAIHERIPLQKA